MSAKPRLPSEIEALFPTEILHKISRYVTKLPKKAPSSSLQDCLEKLQKSPKRKYTRTPMDMYGLDDFVLS